MYILQTHFSGLPLAVTVGVSMASGILTSIGVETAALHYLNGMTVSKAFQTARTMSLISMLAMESSENAFGLILSGGNMASMSWSVMIAAMFVGWLTPLPYNYRQLKLYGKACHWNEAAAPKILLCRFSRSKRLAYADHHANALHMRHFFQANVKVGVVKHNKRVRRNAKARLAAPHSDVLDNGEGRRVVDQPLEHVQKNVGGQLQWAHGQCPFDYGRVRQREKRAAFGNNL